MKRNSTFLAILRDRRGAAVVEFALLAPMVIVMLLGVLMLGIYMQAYNSVRSIVYDAERYTVVEYQKENKMAAIQISQVATAIGTRSPYNFSPDRMSANTVAVATGITGAKRFDLTVSYTPAEISGILKIKAPAISQTETIIVPD